MNRPIFSLVMIALAVLLTGCLPTYVGDPEKATMDPKFVGIWHKTEDKSDELWAVHKLNAHTYLIQSYRFTTGDDNKPTLESSLTFRGWLAPIGGKTFVSLEIFHSAALLEPEETNKDRYAVARTALEGNSLEIRGIDPNFLKGKDVTTPAQLEKLILDDVENDALYLPATKFTKVTAKNMAALQPLIDLIK